MKKLNHQNLIDILNGCAILGTGGGGELDEGIWFIEDALAKGKEFILVDISEVPNEALLCTPYMLGAISALSDEEEQQYARLPKLEEPAIMFAYRKFQQYLGQEFYGTICCELGGSNTAISFYAAAMSGHYIIDADPAGRAVPEITHSTYYFDSLPAAPIMLANEFGESFYCENVMDDKRAEELVRALAIVSRNDIAAIDHALPARQIKDSIISGTISKALHLGEVYREAKALGKDVAQEIAHCGGGYIAFRGRVGENDWSTEQGFTYGNIAIKGTADFKGSNYRIWLKNENMVGWLNGEVHTTIPDLICLIDTQTNEQVTNPNYHEGMQVAVIVLPAPKEFTSSKALSVFGPNYIGIDVDYEPSVERWHSKQQTN